MTRARTTRFTPILRHLDESLLDIPTLLYGLHLCADPKIEIPLRRFRVIVPVLVEWRRDFQAYAVWIVEIDTVDDLMVRRTDDVDSVLLQPIGPYLHILTRRHLKRDVGEDVVRRMGRFRR